MIDSTHPTFDIRSEQWQRCRDCIEGDDAVKGAGEAYLPKLTLQSDAEYEAYKTRADFHGFTNRTHGGLLGMLFGKDPKVLLKVDSSTVQSVIESAERDFDLRGNNLSTYAREVASEVLEVGRCGTWIDFSEAENRAYCSLYKAEDILNWRTERINGRTKLSMVVVREEVETVETEALVVGTKSSDIENDPYDQDSVTILRVMRLVDDGAAGRKVVVEEWMQSSEPGTDGKAIEKVVGPRYKRQQQQKRDLSWVLVKVVEPTRLGKPLTDIPFIFHGPQDASTVVDIPPLLDIANLNLAHYRVLADYRHGMHFTALPTAYVCGFPKDTSLRIGSSEAWVAENPEAKAGYLEFTGTGLGTFTTELERIEKNMAVIGARLLETQKKEAESGDALRLRQAGESSTLQHIANVLSEAMTAAMRLIAWWSDTVERSEEYSEEQISVRINRDFIDAKMPSVDLVNFVSAWLQGGISRTTLFYNLEKGELVPPGLTMEDEVALIEADQAAMLEKRQDEFQSQQDSLNQNQDQNQDPNQDANQP